MNEILGGRTGAERLGCQAPDSGNAEILAHYGPQQKKKYLQLLDGDHLLLLDDRAQAGADPKEFRCRARKEGNEWVIDGEKFFRRTPTSPTSSLHGDHRPGRPGPPGSVDDPDPGGHPA
jgi:hypothetical protein